MSWVARTAAALIALQLVIRAVLAFSGYFYWDDLILTGRAGTQSLLSPSYLFDDHDGHVMPAAFLVAGGITRLAPLNWIGPAISLVVLQLLASLALLRALYVILGWRPVLLLPLTFALFTPLGGARVRLVGGGTELAADAGRAGLGVRRRDPAGAHRKSALRDHRDAGLFRRPAVLREVGRHPVRRLHRHCPAGPRHGRGPRAEDRVAPRIPALDRIAGADRRLDRRIPHRRRPEALELRSVA